MRELTQSDLRDVLDYDPDTGIFRWRVSPTNRVKAGAVAGWRHKEGYREIRIAGRNYLASRLAIFYVTGEWPAELIKYRNGVRDDDRFANLYQATYSENSVEAWKTMRAI
ncbi:HNH endonuclease [Bradyrhizobium sp. CCBAU 51753]|uniref:HNH endonuclease n=1 Tax=Bradyrhizobium sp. CCBAU 51753 TaxID=1325100 RepID=UPI00188AEFB2|nr:hypothetical protein [Bradyrhizobium sp. CCBAU 51753]QOZ26170.1 hypothetical protein XH93_23135 [Bradyrhizobium sp. CCBAU 51753]